MGLFDIVQPVLEEAEVFDSNLLKETINNYIASGKRNFAIDLTPLDYIYSDTINVLMALNKRVLDVSGRLALLGPQPEVLQILKRAGIHNILRVFGTETDLMKTSEDIILQTSSFKMGDIQAIAESVPQESEFDQLRSEIGSVFGSHDVPQEPVMQRPRSSVPMPPPQPVHQEPAFNGSFEQEFTAPPQENFSKPSMPPQFTPPSPQMGFGSYPQQPQFQNRQFSPPHKPTVPQTPAFEPIQKAPQRSFVPPEATNQPDFSSMRPETQRFPTAPVPPLKPIQPHKPEPFITEEADKDLEDFEVPAKKKQKKAREDFDTSDDLFDDEVKKKSPVPMLLLLVLVLAAGGAGVYFGLSKISKKPQVPVTASSAPAVSETPVPSTSPAPEPVIEEKKPEEPPPPPEPEKPAVVEKKAAPRKTASRPASKPRPVSTTVNQVTITSVPTGAAVSINGQRMGTTPYTWSKPVFGQSNISLSKDGYEESSKRIEFTGGTLRESFTLSKAVALVPPPPPRPVVKAEPKITPPSPAPEPDDFSLPESEPAAPPPSPAPVVSGGRGDASIFIASIPPVADVYLDGKLVGKTNVAELKLPVGTYTLRFVKGAKEMSKTVTLTAGKNPSQMVRLP